MPGPIELNPDVIRPNTDLAYKDESGNWRAGPDAVANGHAEQPGQFVSEDYARRARANRQNANMVKQIMRTNGETEGDARETANIILDELEKAESEGERREIWKEYVNSP